MFKIKKDFQLLKGNWRLMMNRKGMILFMFLTIAEIELKKKREQNCYFLL
jgi:hypothetical protein